MGVTDPAQEARIADLRRRWEMDRSSRVFLQLAEEYRRQGKFRDALEVLEGGLREHPSYLSARVALGRTRLEMGQAEGASAVLSEVVAQDPTHMVANKLLVDARLRCGDAAGARERLDLYRLLNDGDPEIEAFEERLAALSSERSPAPVPAAPTLAEPPSALAPPSLADEPGASPAWAPAPPAPAPPERPDLLEPSPTPPPPASAEEPLDRTEPASDFAPTEPVAAASVPSPGPSAAGAGEPFATLVAADRRRYLAGLGEEGIFPVALPPEPPPAAEPIPAEEDEAEVAAETEPEGAVESAPESAEPAAPAVLAGDEEVAQEEGRGEPTVTLGQLYLEQHHYVEAERAFRGVLERDPGNAAALLGLGEVERFRPRPLTARELLSWAEVRGKVEPGRPRRMALLDAYLSRIREGSRTDVP